MAQQGVRTAPPALAGAQVKVKVRSAARDEDAVGEGRRAPRPHRPRRAGPRPVTPAPTGPRSCSRAPAAADHRQRRVQGDQGLLRGLALHRLPGGLAELRGRGALLALRQRRPVLLPPDADLGQRHQVRTARSRGSAAPSTTPTAPGASSTTSAPTATRCSTPGRVSPDGRRQRAATGARAATRRRGRRTSRSGRCSGCAGRRTAATELGVRARLGVEAREVRGLVVGVEAARVREDPDRAAADRLLLQAHRRLRAAERGAVGGEAEDRDQARLDVARRARSSSAAPARSSSRLSSSAARVGRAAMLVMPTP